MRFLPLLILAVCSVANGQTVTVNGVSAQLVPTTATPGTAAAVVSDHYGGKLICATPVPYLAPFGKQSATHALSVQRDSGGIWRLTRGCLWLRIEQDKLTVAEFPPVPYRGPGSYRVGPFNVRIN